MKTQPKIDSVAEVADVGRTKTLVKLKAADKENSKIISPLTRLRPLDSALYSGWSISIALSFSQSPLLVSTFICPLQDLLHTTRPPTPWPRSGRLAPDRIRHRDTSQLARSFPARLPNDHPAPALSKRRSTPAPPRASDPQRKNLEKAQANALAALRKE